MMLHRNEAIRRLVPFRSAISADLRNVAVAERTLHSSVASRPTMSRFPVGPFVN